MARCTPCPPRTSAEPDHWVYLPLAKRLRILVPWCLPIVAYAAAAAYAVFAHGRLPAWLSMCGPAAAAATLIGILRLRAAGLRARLEHLAAGLCPRCGYDLRPTPGRCPECRAEPKGADA